jgi:hypothetical protein
MHITSPLCIHLFEKKNGIKAQSELEQRGSPFTSTAVTFVVTVRTYTTTNQQEIIKRIDINVEDYAGGGVSIMNEIATMIY